MADRVTLEGYTELLRKLKKFEPEVRKDLNRELRTIAGPVLSAARQKASFSTRIPSALGISVTLKGVGIRVSRKKAPHGALFERGAKGGGPIRHPLFGNRQFWYSMPTRPFIQPALDENRGRIVHDVDAAVRATARRVGL